MDRAVSVVIPNYNGGGDLGRLVLDVLATTPQEVNVIIADDGSTNEETKKVLEFCRKLRRVKILKHSNWGVAKTSNHAILYCLIPEHIEFAKNSEVSKYPIPQKHDIIRIDNDIKIIDPHWFEKMTEGSPRHFGITSEDTPIGCYSGLILKEDNKIATAGVPITSKGFFSLRKDEEYNPEINYSAQVEGAYLAATYITYEAICRMLKVHGRIFDERYFPCWVEDVDFCVEIGKLGFATVQTNAPFLHGGGVENNPPGDIKEIKRRNRQTFKDKWGLDIDINI